MNAPFQLDLFSGLKDLPTVARETTPVAVDPAAELAERLAKTLVHPLGSLVLTNNRSRIVSARRKAGALDVRIHRCFVSASPETLDEVAEFLEGAGGRNRQRALAAIRRHFEAHNEREGAAGSRPARRPRRLVLRPVGQTYNLLEILDDINERYFQGELNDLKITWGRRLSERRKRRSPNSGISIRLGAYHDGERLIRIHRALDQSDVPLFVVESVVHHEMLHAVVPIVQRRGERRRIHTPEFRRREREYEHFEKAERWISKNLRRLAGH